MKNVDKIYKMKINKTKKKIKNEEPQIKWSQQSVQSVSGRFSDDRTHNSHIVRPKVEL